MTLDNNSMLDSEKDNFGGKYEYAPFSNLLQTVGAGHTVYCAQLDGQKERKNWLVVFTTNVSQLVYWGTEGTMYNRLCYVIKREMTFWRLVQASISQNFYFILIDIRSNTQIFARFIFLC